MIDSNWQVRTYTVITSEKYLNVLVILANNNCPMQCSWFDNKKQIFLVSNVVFNCFS